MKPEGKGEFDSLYFNYPTFEAPNREEVLSSCEHRIAIVGAGPVGMFAALTLARFGVSSVLFDKKSTFNDGSRAICVQRSSYQALERAGAVAPFLKKSLGWTKGRTFFRGRQILEFEMPHGENEKYLPMYNIQQQFIEQYLWDAVAASDLIETRWCSEVVALRDTEAGVELTVSDPNGGYMCNADWLLAADGARSQIRKMRSLSLQGQNFEGRYVIADIQMDHDYPTIRRALFDSKSNPDMTILIHRQPDNIWRIDYQIPDDQDADEAIREDKIRANVTSILNDIGHAGDWELEWWSIYTANTLALNDYRDGRVLFIGDSAHIVPIFGVRGLNNGLADAENVGWKMARVLKGQSDENLLNSYSPERRGATLEVFHFASKSARFMTPPTEGWRIMRDAALSLSLDHEFAGEFANPRQMEPFTYSDGGAIFSDCTDLPAGIRLGAILSDEKLSDTTYLSDLLGNSFTVLCLSGDAGALQSTLAETDVEIRVLSIRDISDVYGDEAGARVAARIGNEGALMLRPDGYLCGYWKQIDADKIAAQFHATFAPKETL